MFKRASVNLRAMFGDRGARAESRALDRLRGFREWSAELREGEAAFKARAAGLAATASAEGRQRVEALLVAYDQTRGWLDKQLDAADVAAGRGDWSALGDACDTMDALRGHFDRDVAEADRLLASRPAS